MKEYWQQAALDPQVDDKYICDVSTLLCLEDLGELKGKVLEIGCGVGRLMQNNSQYYGIDISDNMLKIAKKRKPKCNFSLSENNTIPYKNNMFDTIFCYLVVQHLKPEEVQQYFNEAYRVLKENGTFTFQFIQGTEREPLSNHYTKKEMEIIAEKAGFKRYWHRPSDAHYLWTIVRLKK